MFGVFKYDENRLGISVIKFSGIIILPVFIFIGLWMYFAPLSSAALAPGQIVLSADRNIVQHLEGGIIEKLFVTEGQTVKKNDPILLIRSLPQKSQKIVLYDRIVDTRTIIMRLQAQINEFSEIDFSVIESEMQNVEINPNKYIKQQQSMFVAFRNLLSSREDLIKNKSNKIELEIEGINARMNAKIKQLKIEKELLSIKKSLAKQGLTPKIELLILEKSIAILFGDIASNKAAVKSLRRGISISKLEEIERKEQERMMFLTELQQLQTVLKTLEQEGETLDDQLNRTLIKAPIDGKVLDLQIQAAGEVLPSGGRILDLIPIEQSLIVEAKINPKDVDSVVVGGKAKIQLSAYNTRKVPRLDGSVLTVSGDVLSDPLSGEKYYLARIDVDTSILDQLKSDIVLSPGMSVDVFLLAQELTLLDYLISPISNATYRAFREE